MQTFALRGVPGLAGNDELTPFLSMQTSKVTNYSYLSTAKT